MQNETHEFPVSLSGAANTLMWADEYTVEPQARQQLRNIASLPWVHGVRVMPDVHLGKGATVGSVIAMPNALSPAAVGVDLGCGMTAVRTSLTVDDLGDNLSALRANIESLIPVGFHMHDETVGRLSPALDARRQKLWGRFTSVDSKVHNLEGKAQRQTGSLGGGNHFLEVTLDADGVVWLMLHSGSRNIGKELAEIHIEKAKNLPHNEGLPDRDLAVFLADTPEMAAYRHDLQWAQEYAYVNREVMMELFKKALEQHVNRVVTYDSFVTCHHNYVSEETIDGQSMLVTRKGAISAKAGERGIIPGSMGTGSYIVKGLGNPQGYMSASHGAGRRMSRSQAKKLYTVEDLQRQTAGVESRKDKGVVDEIPAAYKKIEDVIAAQDSLVEVVTRLDQIVCVKG